jgi:hypothetical protein
VTLIGLISDESSEFEQALARAGASLAIQIKQEPAAASSSFPLEQIHAVIFTPASLATVTLADVAAVRSAMEPGTCRVYLWVPSESSPRFGVSPLDDFIQRTSMHSADAVAEQVIAYFREASYLNAHSTLRSLRDRRCLAGYGVLKFLWPLGYIAAAFHFLNTAAALAGQEQWAALFANPFAISLATFFGVFFIVHCILVIVRNALLGIRIAKRFGREFIWPAGCLAFAVAATARSIAVLDGSASRILASAILAMAVYRYYVYCRRIRAECTSLSQIQADMADSRRRVEMLTAIGRGRFRPFPFVPFRLKTLFISYMHGSEWSSETAATIHRWTTEHGFDVFLDQHSLAAGTLWRQFLLRACSECGWFIAVLDGEVVTTDWVLAESAYAALLRKNIGKPNILIIVRNTEALSRLRRSPFGLIYRDVFQLPPARCYGAAILVIGGDELTGESILRVMKEIRPMCLLPADAEF